MSARRRLKDVRLRAAFFAGLLLLLLAVFLRPSTAEPTASVIPEIEVRFTRPEPGGPRSLRGGPDADLAQAIGEAGDSIEMAIYDLDLWSVRDALLAAHRRGVAVRLVIEREHLDLPEVGDLIAAGIPVVADDGQALMHDKFTVIDGMEVWTGSMNYTVHDAYRNDNNLVRLRSEAVAAAYRDEFDEMFTDGIFGAVSPSDSGRRLRLTDGSEIEIYFAPDNRPGERLLELIAGARNEIEFLAFAFTSGDLAEALMARAADGVRVRGVIEAGQAENLGSQWPAFRQAGLEVRLDANPDNMHHKVLVIDGTTTVFGSYNLSRSAESFNDENLIVVHLPEVAARFQAEFERIFAAAR